MIHDTTELFYTFFYRPFSEATEYDITVYQNMDENLR